MKNTKQFIEDACDYQELWQIAEELLSRYPGNIIEIGAGIGENTVGFLGIASTKNSKVIVIDPFSNVILFSISTINVLPTIFISLILKPYI